MDQKRKRWIVLGGCWLVMAFVFGCGWEPSGVFILPLVKQFGWTRFQVSMLNMALAIALGASCPLVGWLVDRTQAPFWMIFGSAVTGVALLFASMGNSFGALFGADPVNQAYHFLVGNQAAVPGILYTMIIGAGFGEETVFRGYMFERLGKLFSTSAGSRVFIVLLTATLFGLAHYSTQGVTGAEQAVITGLVFGTIFAVTRQLWMLMCAHAAYDLTAVAIIYWNVESKVAHLVLS